MLFLLLLSSYTVDSAGPPPCYKATVTSLSEKPVIAAVFGQSDFSQVFNPSFVEASPGTHGVSGLVIRSQNCTEGCGPTPNGAQCCHCAGTGQKASLITFAKLLSDDSGPADPKFSHISESSVVFGPHDR